MTFEQMDLARRSLRIMALNDARRLPAEVVLNIADLADDEHNDTTWNISTRPASTKMLAAIPPANGTCPIMALSTELRRSIFDQFIISRGIQHHPNCEDEWKHGSRERNNNWVKAPRSNKTSDLMILNKKLCGEITELLYEEHFFVVHVHEGIRKGGIELLNAGRQPLQYKDCNEDPRFFRFGEDDDFGLCRMKKIVVQIFPAAEELSGCRHAPINTYCMNLALVRLLHRSGLKSDQITHLVIEFMQGRGAQDQAGRSAISRAEHYWWDPEAETPRETSIHNVPNIELVLRPFAQLSRVHNVEIKLPAKVQSNERVRDFVEELKTCMTSKSAPVLRDHDGLEWKIESAREAMEDYVNYMLHGRGHNNKVEKLTEAEMQESYEESVHQKNNKRRKVKLLFDDQAATYGRDVADDMADDVADGSRVLGPHQRTAVWRGPRPVVARTKGPISTTVTYGTYPPSSNSTTPVSAPRSTLHSSLRARSSEADLGGLADGAIDRSIGSGSKRRSY